MFTCNIPQLTLIQLKYDCDIENISPELYGPWNTMFMQSSFFPDLKFRVNVEEKR